jgi:hypothetical protein
MFAVQVMVTVEEGAIGGFAAHVLNFLINEGLMDSGNLKFRSMMLPDRWVAALSASNKQAAVWSSQCTTSSMQDRTGASVRRQACCAWFSAAEDTSPARSLASDSLTIDMEECAPGVTC